MQGEPDQVELGEMTRILGFLLRLAQIEAFERLFAGEDMPEGRLSDLSILHLVRLNPGIRQGMLARALRIKRAHMTKIMQALEGRGLCRSTIPSEDRRAVQLWLTEAGEALISAAWPQVCDREARVSDGLTAVEAATLKRLLRKFVGVSQTPRNPREDPRCEP